MSKVYNFIALVAVVALVLVVLKPLDEADRQYSLFKESVKVERSQLRAALSQLEHSHRRNQLLQANLDYYIELNRNLVNRLEVQ